MELTTFLRNRGYPTTLIRKQLEAVRTIPHQEVLQTRRRNSSANRVPLVCMWSQQLPPLSQLIDRSHPILQANARLRRVFERPLVSYRRPSNLRDVLVRTRRKQRNSRETAGTFPCNAARCKACPLTKQAGIVPLPSPQGKFSCRSSNVVHAIICTACNAMYIGETGAACCTDEWAPLLIETQTRHASQWQSTSGRRITKWQFASFRELRRTLR